MTDDEQSISAQTKLPYEQWVGNEIYRNLSDAKINYEALCVYQSAGTVFNNRVRLVRGNFAPCIGLCGREAAGSTPSAAQLRFSLLLHLPPLVHRHALPLALPGQMPPERMHLPVIDRH